MRKSLFYRWFGIGAIPKRYQTVLQAEGILVADEGLRGWCVSRNVKGPGKRYFRRAEGFSGWLVVTRKRVVGYSWWKRQINIGVDDPKLSALTVSIPKPGWLSISFETSVFRENWQGVMEFQFATDKADEFCRRLVSLGAEPGGPDQAR